MDPLTLPYGSSSQQKNKTDSFDFVKANSCVELEDVRKLKNLLNQCESISCEDLLQHQDVSKRERKYASTPAIYGTSPKISEHDLRRKGSQKHVAENRKPINKCCNCFKTTSDNYRTKSQHDCLSYSLTRKLFCRATENECICETSSATELNAHSGRPSSISSTASSKNCSTKLLIQLKQITVSKLEAAAYVSGSCSENNLENELAERKASPSIKQIQQDIKCKRAETSMPKAKGPRFWRINSEDDTDGVKESLLEASKSAEKKRPEHVETVSYTLKYCLSKFFKLLLFLHNRQFL